MMHTLYKAAVWLYFSVIRAAALFNPKAALFFKGRKNLFQNIKQNLVRTDHPMIWFHAASLGEFEQGRPLIEQLKKQVPNVQILLTFFSPSGFEVRKGYAVADYICYLPTESAENVKRFYDLTRPTVAVFIKYEFWKQYLDEARRRHIRLVSVSSIFRANQIFFKRYAGIFRESLRGFDHFFVQNEQSKDLLNSIGIPQATVAGDTRFDRVVEIKKAAKKIETAELFKNGELVVVLGSVWPSDMVALYQVINNLGEKAKFIIAPHQIENGFLSKIEAKCQPKSVRFSRAGTENLPACRILLIDNIGMLSSLYGYGEIAFVGGGFRGGLHNTLEPAAFGIPVLWGHHSRNQKFREVAGLAASGGGIAIQSATHAHQVVEELLSDEQRRQTSGAAAGRYVESNIGATEMIVNHLTKMLKGDER